MIINGIKLLTDWNPYEDLLFFFSIGQTHDSKFWEKKLYNKKCFHWQ